MNNTKEELLEVMSKLHNLRGKECGTSLGASLQDVINKLDSTLSRYCNDNVDTQVMELCQEYGEDLLSGLYGEEVLEAKQYLEAVKSFEGYEEWVDMWTFDSYTCVETSKEKLKEAIDNIVD